MNKNGLPVRLAEIVEDFELCEGQEKIEMLLQFAESMRPLPEHLTGKSAEFEQVHECMTPVFVHPEVLDGKMKFYFDVPKESPTVRGFASILGEGLDGATPKEILEVPDDFFVSMGLDKVLTHQRLHGMAGMVAHIKRLAATELKA